MFYGLRILTADVMQDSRVVVHDRVDRVQVNGTLVVVECIIELAGTFHVDSHILEDARFFRVVPDRILVLRQSLLAIAKLLIDNSQVHLCFVVIGLQAQNLYKISRSYIIEQCFKIQILHVLILSVTKQTSCQK